MRTTFSTSAWSHIYKRRADGNLIFYSVRDYLVYFTVFCTMAVKRRMQVIGLSIMCDHIHELICSRSYASQAAFEQDVNSVYAKEWNRASGLSGQCFETYGFAQKRGDKYKRNCVAYLANNPGERKLCSRVEDYRWNFIAYAASPNPYSAPVRSRHCSTALQRAMDRVHSLHSRGRWLSYPIIDSLVRGIPKDEMEAFIDFVISTYNVIDYQAAIDLYGSYEQMLTAINANTGNEHDIKESFVGYDDTVYRGMTRYMIHQEGLKDIKQVITLPSERKFSLFVKLQAYTGADIRQVSKYLHYPIKHVRSFAIDTEEITDYPFPENKERTSRK